MLITRYTPWLTRSINIFAIVAMLFSMVPVTAASSSASVAIHLSPSEAGKAAAPRQVREAPLSRAPLAIQPDLHDRPLLVGEIITATKRDSLLVDNDSDLLADPGDVLLYTVVISNTGSTATGVVFTDTIDNNTTLVPGSVKTTPLALNDAYTATGNISITVTGGINLLANDSDPDGSGAVIVSSFDTTSVQGGNVSVSANGDFTYNPPAGYTGTDTFTYTVQDVDGNHDTATVTITISGMIWFINNNAAACTLIASGCGRLSSPFSTLAAFNTVNNGSGNNPATNDNIFIYESSTSYTGPATLLSGQKLIGQDSTSNLITLTGLTPPTYAASLPSMNSVNGTFTKITSATTDVTLNSGNSLYGFTADIATGIAISSTVAFGILTANAITITTTGAGLALVNGTANVTFNSITSSGGTNNISLTTVAGTLNLGSGALSGASGTAFNVSGGTGALTYSGTISKTSGGRLADIQNHSTGNITLSGATLTCNSGCTGINIASNSSGTITFSGSTKTINTGTNAAVTLSSNTGATINFTGGGLNIDTTSGAGFNAAGGGTVTVSGSSNTIDTTTGTALNVTSTTIGGSGLAFLSISANGAANGIILNATGANGLTVTGTGTTNGSGGTIQNISARGASFISANNISLSNMIFNDVGTTNGADPTIATSGCGDLVSGNNLSCNAGIHLQTVTDVTLTNIDMNNDSGGNSSGQIGINGDTVTDFVLSNSNVLNFGNETREDGLKFHNLLGTSSIAGTTISGNEMVQVQVENDSGTLTKLDVSNTIISTSAAPNGNHGILFDTHGSATGKLQVQGTTFSNLFSNCIDALGDGATGGLTVVVDGSTGSPKNSFTGCGASAITIAQNGAAPVSFNITNNGTSGSPTFLGGTSSHAININQAGSAPQTAVMQGAITNNFIGDNSSSTSSTVGGSGIQVLTIAPGTLTVLVSGNTVQGVGGNGINMQIGEETNTAQRMNTTVLNNTALVTYASGFDGIRFNAGTSSSGGGDLGTMCAEINGNTGSSTPGSDFVVRQRFGTDFLLRGYTGTNTDANNPGAVQTHLDINQNNTASNSTWFITSNVSGGGGGFVNTPSGAQCPQPTVPVLASLLNDHFLVKTPFESNPLLSAQAASPSTVESSSAKLFKPTGSANLDSLLSPVNSPLFSGENISITIGDFPTGEIITVTFAVTISNPLTSPADATTVSNQGHVSWSSGSIVTDDPDTGTANDPTVTSLDLKADLALTKSDGGISVQPGDLFTHTLVYTNTGPNPAPNVTLTETVPTNTTYTNTGAGWTCVGSTCTKNVGSLGLSASGSITFTLTVTNPVPAGVTTITNTATIGSGIPDPVSGNNTALDTTPVNAQPDFQLSKTDGGLSATPSGVLTYTLTYTNTGNQNATGVELNETVPAHTTFTGSGWTCTPNPGPGSTCTKTIGALAGGVVTGTAIFTVTVVASGEPPIPAGVDTITNTAVIDDDGTNGADPTPGNNTAVDTTPLNAQPDFTLNKSDGGVTAVPGDVVTYTLSYANLGNQSATGVVLTETVPANTTFAGSGWTGCTSGSSGGTVCTKSIGSLAGGGVGFGTAVFVITVTNPITAGVISITNTAQIGDDGSNGADPTPASNTAIDSTPVTAAPDLKIVKSDGGIHGTPGSVIQYTLTFTNTGNQGATSIVLSDTVPANSTFKATSSHPDWVCSPGNNPGSTCTITMTTSLAGGNATSVITFALQVDNPFPLSEPSITNTASITDDGTNGVDVTPANNVYTDTTPIDNLPDLKLTKSDGDISVPPGGIITYTLTYTNLGGLAAPNTIISDTVPQHTTFAGSGWTGCSLSSPAGTVCTKSVGTVAGGGSGSVVFVVKVENPITTGVDKIYNTAVITDDGSNGEDPNSGNNAAMDYTPVDAAPDLRITKSDGGVNTTPGGVITYTLTYTNIGNQGATGIVLTDTVPANTTYADGGWICAPGNSAGSICVLSVGNLAINGSGTATLVLTVTNPVPAGVTLITNTASINDDGDNGNDLNYGDNTSTDTTPLTAAPNLQVTKDDGGITVVPGDTITYTVTYTNTGNQGATGVVLTETVPANTTFTGSGWICTPGSTAGSICTFAVGDLDAGSNGTVLFVVTTAITMPAGVNVISNTVSIGDDGANGADQNSGDNTDTDTTPVNAAPDLQITKSDGGITATAGSPIIYTLTYTNTGNQGATGVIITETVPTNTAAVSGGGWTCASGTCTFSAGSLAAGGGGSTTFTVTVASTIPAGVTTITNTVLIGDNGANGADPNSSDNTATEVTPLLAAPNLKVTKTDGGVSKTPGSVLTYTVTYTNTGTQGATGVVLTETVPANTIFSGAGWSCGTITPGSVCTKSIGGLAASGSGSTSFVLMVTSTVPAGVTTITNTVIIGDDGANGADLNPADNTGMDTTPLNAAPDLQITKSDNNLNTYPTTFINYTLIITNTGTQDAVGVVITDVVPANAIFFDSGWTGCVSGVSTGGTVCTKSISSLPAGSSNSSISILFQINPAAPSGVTMITNTATVGDNGANGADLNPADNSDSETTPVLRTDLFLTKSDGGVTTTPGGVISYTLTYTNIGTWESNGVVMTDTVPLNTTFNLGSSSGGWSCANGAPAGSVCTIAIGTVLTSTGGVRTFAVNVNNPLPGSVTTITNTATIGDNGAAGLDNNPSNNTATDTTLLSRPDLTVTKSDGGVTKTPGSVLTYTVTYTNTGTHGATGVVLTETVPANTTFSGSGWTGCVNGSPAGTVCTSLGGLAVGGSGSTLFVLTITSSVPAGVTTITNTVTIGDDGADLNPANNTGTDTTPLNAAPDLRITKDDNSANTVPGAFISYNLIYTNTGNQGAVGVIITDVVPANTTFSTASTPGWSCANGAPAGSVCTYSVGGLNVGSAGSVLYVLQANLSTPVGVTVITNTSTISDNGANGADLNPANNSDSETTPLLRPDLSLTKDDGGATAAAGGVINYTLTYSNIGTWQSNGVVLTDTVPLNTTFNLGASSGGWSCANGAPAGSVCTLSIGTVLTSTGGSRIFAVNVNNPLPSGMTTITNTATIGDNGAYGLDNNPSNNTATEVTAGLFKMFLPVVMKNYADGPDLVVTQLLASSNAITVTIKNIGTVATAASFWVDVYINPSTPPTQVNQLWSSLGTRGAAWGVTTVISPNDVLTLTIGGPYYSPANSNLGGPLTPSTPVYAQVDSFNGSTTYGAVLENHEIAGDPYNNITGPTSSVLSLGAQAAMSTTAQSAASSSAGLAPLPPRNLQQVLRRRP